MDNYDPATLFITHIFDGEEVVRAGEDGEIHVAVFTSTIDAEFFIWCKQRFAK